ncbi:LysM peptidoglycan-binding domain-containing protein [Mucilaginibacter sp. BJC16-A38]|uniref:lytic transglycosylase domain-containing protein n=1 Tax=Mucilaginibacter phenanthrenivorans TaxID=1234842 RepID=UPI002156F8E6|nr:lytic transglycosylase domain-containing protein [Mucilaginibacter phenanthrenivorans]MCR8558452.1 LysM peptidoglycan-binding domain-containing protein [Mucilaginibacter phenanthrenivorans]
MKKTLTLIICLLSLQFAKAAPDFFQNDKLTGDDIKAHTDTTILPVVNQPAPLPYQSGIYKKRLDSIKKDIPLDYNEYVQSYIEIYMRNREEMGKVLGLTKYYFPIYEKAFHDAGIPDEIKYLSIVESKLDPYAVSRVGATGPWQFMFTTARLYGLNMDDYVDERRDPIQASYAAAAYLKDAYQEFGDWLLAIASYNCGKSNVERAIEKAGGATDFWSIRQYLPNETRGYVPAFIAVAYVMNYYNHHNIVPQVCNIAMKTDTVLVNKFLPLSTVAQTLNLDLAQLTILNPSYKRQIINGTANKPRRMIIPQIDKTKYAALYEALNNSTYAAAAPQPMVYAAAYHERKEAKTPSYHKVRRGETLRDIADNYGIEVQDIKVWNHLHSNKAVVGQRLKVKESADEPEEKPAKSKTHNYVTYKVKRGDTLSGIASKFDGASVAKIRELNGLKKGELQPGMTIKISKG